MEGDIAGPSRGSRRRPQGKKRKLLDSERSSSSATHSVERGRKRKKVSEIIGSGSWVCRESYCGLSLPDEGSLERHYRGHCAQEEEKLARGVSNRNNAI